MSDGAGVSSDGALGVAAEGGVIGGDVSELPEGCVPVPPAGDEPVASGSAGADCVAFVSLETVGAVTRAELL